MCEDERVPTPRSGKSTAPPSPSGTSNDLLSPVAHQAARHLRAGGKIRQVEQVKWSPQLATLIHNRVSEWLCTGHVESLGSLLSEFPGALAHPAVITSVIKMRRLAANVEIAELAGDVNVDGEFFSAEACGAARDALHSIATALVSGLIGDGWSFIILRIRGGIPCFEEVMPIRGGHQPESGSLSHGHDSWNSGYRPHDWSICRTALPDDRPCRRGERPQAPEHLCPLIVALPPPT